MKVQVKLYGMLRSHRPEAADGAPHHPFELTVPEGATAVHLAKELSIEDGLVTGVAINGQTADLGTALQDGDQISLFPPSAGGSQPMNVLVVR